MNKFILVKIFGSNSVVRTWEWVVEGKSGGRNSSMPERIQKGTALATPLVKNGSQTKFFLFFLEEKNRRTQIKKYRENFSVLVPPK